MSNTPTTETAEQTPPPIESTEPVDYQAEAEKWKTLADQTEKRLKRFEDQAKANAAAAKELEALKASSMTELEKAQKAVETARAEGYAEAARIAGARLVEAELKAALAGRNVDVEAILEGIDPARFVDEDGNPNIQAITAWADRIAPPPDPNAKPGFPDLGQGVRGGGTNGSKDPLVASLEQLVSNSFGGTPRR